jgi:5'-nucleotidase
MNNDRRVFLNQMSLIAGIAVLSKPLASAAAISRRVNTLNSIGNSVTIFHTNDLYGNIESSNGSLGGLKQIKTLLEKQETAGLILDAGDFLNSSHSLHQQKAVINIMNRVGYHAAGIGDQELLNGQENLAQLAPLMQFSLVNCNYEFNSALNRLIKPYIIIYSGKYKIGITGVGHQVKGVVYNDAIKCANNMARLLKEREHCDLVLCLSHLGYSQDGDQPDNLKLAKQSQHIDMIISGHDYKLLRGPVIVLNKLKEQVVISQAAWDGLMVGKTIFGFENEKQKLNFKGKHFITGQPYGQTFADAFSGLQSLEKLRVSV